MVYPLCVVSRTLTRVSTASKPERRAPLCFLPDICAAVGRNPTEMAQAYITELERQLGRCIAMNRIPVRFDQLDEHWLWPAVFVAIARRGSAAELIDSEGELTRTSFPMGTIPSLPLGSAPEKELDLSVNPHAGFWSGVQFTSSSRGFTFRDEDKAAAAFAANFTRGIEDRVRVVDLGRSTQISLVGKAPVWAFGMAAAILAAAGCRRIGWCVGSVKVDWV